ncbi:hypothetical protein VII00023_08929 [Vibrio ichthyoenteri ATCC 700023]|uniref:DUF2809 domain-containing protein n=1 Tax=Vibrio ichthyoenteri ATCC 700023 TaxID=870968 RepID=F9S585_9VIBR|nr:DUF2809 domain-containing protein [Vibrio ichthyoenteri]EGU35951.1 hypothetical protein VII00023_08929 [Vibrio ichthyoenteri ATCC 700023]
MKSKLNNMVMACEVKASQRIYTLLCRHLRFSLRYAVIALCWLVVLVNIALFVDDTFIRPTLGDVLVVVWLYYTIRSVVDFPARWLVLVTVMIAYMVEFAQYLKVPALLGLEPGSPLSIILGATFDWLDLLAYSAGAIMCWLVSREQGINNEY